MHCTAIACTISVTGLSPKKSLWRSAERHVGIVGVSILIASVILVFAGIIHWAAAIQPRAERARAALSPEDAWRESGFESLRKQGFVLCQIVPTDHMLKAEFVFWDEDQRELGRYTSKINKSATIEYSGKTITLYIQGATPGGSAYAGKVGGTANDSIVIRDDHHVIAEAWRETTIPPIRYRFVYSGDTFEIRTGGLSPTSAGTIQQSDKQVATFRRPSLAARNTFIAFRKELADELKVCFCSIVLLD